MTQHSDSSDPHRCVPSSETTWIKLYALLRVCVKHWISSSRLSSWYGQEDDLVEDIVQEAITRVFKQTRKVELGVVPPIDSIEHLGIKIAYHCYIDKLRRDRRLVRIVQEDRTNGEYRAGYDAVDTLDEALTNVSQELLFTSLAVDIDKFPLKLKTALLIDLANRMGFDEKPTALQKAFLKVGIRLQDYQLPVSSDRVIRSRHASLLSLAYRRIRELDYAKQHSSVA